MLFVEGAGEGDDGLAVIGAQGIEVVDEFSFLFFVIFADDAGREEASEPEDTFGGDVEGPGDAVAEFRPSATLT